MPTVRLPRRAALKLGAAIVGVCLLGGGQQGVHAQTPAPAQIPGPPAATAQEQAFLAALAASTRVELSPDHLTLRDAGGATQVVMVR